VADDIEAQGEEAKEPSKKSPMKLIIIIVATVVLAGGGFVGWTMIQSEPEKAAPAEVKSSGKKPGSAVELDVGQMFQLDPFVVNLNDPGGKRYLKAKIELEYSSIEVKNELTARLPQLRDVILLHLSSKSMEEIQSTDGKIELRSSLIMRINQITKAGKIRNLYFTQFVIQ